MEKEIYHDPCRRTTAEEPPLENAGRARGGRGAGAAGQADTTEGKILNCKDAKIAKGILIRERNKGLSLDSFPACPLCPSW
jgi:hypothetical protein